MCKSGRHTKGGKAIINCIKRSVRRQTKLALRNGDEPLNKVSVPYTD